jgi:hypothetical protein
MKVYYSRRLINFQIFIEMNGIKNREKQISQTTTTKATNSYCLNNLLNSTTRKGSIKPGRQHFPFNCIWRS